MLVAAVFWVFQVINGLTSLGMMVAPKHFHESMFKRPEEAYKALGFSPLAVGMLHNVIRGQGAALLAISVYLAAVGHAARESFLLIGLTCTLALAAHVVTLVHHERSPIVMAAIGSTAPLKGILVVNAVVAVAAFATFF